MCTEPSLPHKMHLSLMGGDIKIDLPLLEDGHFLQHKYCLGCRRLEGRRVLFGNTAPPTPIVWTRCSKR